MTLNDLKVDLSNEGLTTWGPKYFFVTDTSLEARRLLNELVTEKKISFSGREVSFGTDGTIARQYVELPQT